MAFCVDLLQNPCRCYSIWWCGSLGIFVKSLLLWTGCFAAIYHAAAWVIFPRLAEMLKRFPSKYANEESCHWFASHIQSTLHTIILLYIAIPATIDYMSKDPLVKFGLPGSSCGPGATQNDMEIRATIANASLVFMGHLVSDLVLGLVYGHADKIVIVHHILFICFVLLVFYNCSMVYLGGRFLMMEISTLFLNYYSFFRNRLGYAHWSVKLDFMLFAISFASCRMIGGVLLGVEFYLAVYNGHLSHVVPWHLLIICSAVVGSFFMNVMWFYGIVEKTGRIYFSSSKQPTEEQFMQVVHGNEKKKM